MKKVTFFLFLAVATAILCVIWNIGKFAGGQDGLKLLGRMFSVVMGFLVLWAFCNKNISMTARELITTSIMFGVLSGVVETILLIKSVGRWVDFGSVALGMSFMFSGISLMGIFMGVVLKNHYQDAFRKK